MNNPKWTAVDTYLDECTAATDPILDAALAANKKAGLPAIDVSPTQGKLLHLQARMCGARHILEIGTLGGYSSIWLARALPADGLLVTLEASPAYVEVAKANIARAGLADHVEVRVGPALETLPKIEAEARAPFDLIFIDADKTNNADYVAWALKLSRPGSVIILDNVVRAGAILDADSDDDAIIGTRRALDMLVAEPRLTATAIQTVGSKGWDGFMLAVVD